jgi:hypothetical protein
MAITQVETEDVAVRRAVDAVVGRVPAGRARAGIRIVEPRRPAVEPPQHRGRRYAGAAGDGVRADAFGGQSPY